jgi:chemotaxis protein histidine kinase CheA
LPDNSSEAVRGKLDELWNKYHHTLQSRIETIATAVNDLQDGSLSEELRHKAVQAAHNLAGSLGTFGLEEGSHSAHKIEAALRTARASAVELAADLECLRRIVAQK